MSKALLIRYIPNGTTGDKYSLRCERCNCHICYVEPKEAAQMCSDMSHEVPILCWICEGQIGMTETIIINLMAECPVNDVGVIHANRN